MFYERSSSIRRLHARKNLFGIVHVYFCCTITITFAIRSIHSLVNNKTSLAWYMNACRIRNVSIDHRYVKYCSNTFACPVLWIANFFLLAYYIDIISVSLATFRSFLQFNFFLCIGLWQELVYFCILETAEKRYLYLYDISVDTLIHASIFVFLTCWYSLIDLVYAYSWQAIKPVNTVFKSQQLKCI